MLAYRILCPGRRATDPLLVAAQDYGERLKRYAKFELVRLKESDPVGEAALMLSHLAPTDYVIALDERGSQPTTMALHDQLLALDARGQGRITWLIGGAAGLGPAARARCQATLALSKLTLPHRAALMILLEQLYRVHTLMRGEKYHKP
jgi:23S rRNA (pseudouridine1915-N3)-methyltransferase